MRLKAVISYKGTLFYGFQIQTNSKLRSVQGEIEKVLEQIFGEHIKIHASGRTDRGVHALGQVIHFDVNTNLTPYRIIYSINCLLPKDIHFDSLEEVSVDFHSRYSALSKTYRYVISQREESPLYCDLVYTCKRKLDVNKMKDAMEIFLGEHDFHNFCINDEDFIRNIMSFTLTEENGILTFIIKGNGFRRYMVRMIIGCLIQVGLNKMTKEELLAILEDPNMNRVRHKAPSEGLYLEKVCYKEDDND